MNSANNHATGKSEAKNTALIPVVTSAVITGLVSGVVTVSTLSTDVDWMKNELNDLNGRVLHIEREGKYGKSRTEKKRTTQKGLQV
ncbi:hypothetical protein AB2S62_21700 [Vibrio sp. NTOU-M3]|uniref:hypothetical protein n=1 Tax=Vibrio sp. NTOU-M3 TaxID=3234954 RepID=UPI00349F507F